MKTTNQIVSAGFDMLNSLGKSREAIFSAYFFLFTSCVLLLSACGAGEGKGNKRK